MTITLAQINETLVTNDKQIIQNTEESKDYLKSIDAGIKKFLQNQENQRLDNLEDRRENKKLLKLLTPEKTMLASAADKMKDAGKSFWDSLPNPLEALGIASLVKSLVRMVGRLLRVVSAITGLTTAVRALRGSIDSRFNTPAGQDAERLKAQQAAAEELRKQKLAEAEEANKKRAEVQRQIREAEKEAKRAADEKARVAAEEKAKKLKADRDAFRAAELESREAAKTAGVVSDQAKIMKKRINRRPMMSRYSTLANDLQIADRIQMGDDELKRFQVRQENIDVAGKAEVPAPAPKVQTEVSDLKQAQAIVAENIDNLPPGIRVASNGALMRDTPAGPKFVSAKDVAPMIQQRSAPVKPVMETAPAKPTAPTVEASPTAPKADTPPAKPTVEAARAPDKPTVGSVTKSVAGAAVDMVNPVADLRDLAFRRGVSAGGKALAAGGLLLSAVDAKEGIVETTRANVEAGKDTTRAQSTGAALGGAAGGFAGLLDLGNYGLKSIGRLFTGKTNEEVAAEAFGEDSFAVATKDAVEAGVTSALLSMDIGTTAVSKETELARLTGGFTPETFLQGLVRGSVPLRGVDRQGKGAPKLNEIQNEMMRQVYSDPNATDEQIYNVPQMAKAEYERQLTEYLLQNEKVQAKLAELQASIDLVEAKYAKANEIREAGQEEAVRSATPAGASMLASDNSVNDNSNNVNNVTMNSGDAIISHDASGGIRGFGTAF